MKKVLMKILKRKVSYVVRKFRWNSFTIWSIWKWKHHLWSRWL